MRVIGKEKPLNDWFRFVIETSILVFIYMVLFITSE